MYKLAVAILLAQNDVLRESPPIRCKRRNGLQSPGNTGADTPTTGVNKSGVGEFRASPFRRRDWT
jgi:hypothetical protein